VVIAGVSVKETRWEIVPETVPLPDVEPSVNAHGGCGTSVE
jgi:hypothetical protein